MKKIISKSLILALVMVLALYTIVNAETTENGLIYQLDEYGTATITGIEKAATSIDIPATIGEASVEVGESAFAGNASLQTVKIANDVTVHSKVFSGCTKLSTVTFGQNAYLMGDNIFEGTAIKELHFGAGASVASGLFNGMTNLETIRFDADVWIDNTYWKLDSATEAYIKNNVTVYGYPSEDASEDSSADNRIVYSPMGWANNHGFKFVNLAGESEEKLAQKSLVDETTGITVTGIMSKDAKLIIEKMDSNSETYKNMVYELKSQLKGYDIAGAYLIEIDGDYEETHDLYVKIPVNAKYNGLNANIFHDRSDSYDMYSAKVSDGAVIFEPKGFSPFIVAVKTNANSASTGTQSAGTLDETPKTGTIDYSILAITTVIISSIALAVIIRKK